jgi:predicted TIM-barrel fold metal-dependent hydrolase
MSGPGILRTTPMRPADTNTVPAFVMPAGACDTHFHAFEPGYPHVPDPLYTFPEGTLAQYLEMARFLGFQRMIYVQPTYYGTDNSLAIDVLRRVGRDRCRAVVRVERTPPTRNWTVTTSRRAPSASTCLQASGPAGYHQYIGGWHALPSRGWHLQFYTPGTIVRDLLPFLADFADTFTIDPYYMLEADRLSQADFDRRCVLRANC